MKKIRIRSTLLDWTIPYKFCVINYKNSPYSLFGEYCYVWDTFESINYKNF